MAGFDYSEFDELITQVEQFGADMDQVAERVLDAGSEPARQAFQKAVPRSKKDKDHAQDNITVSKTKKSKYGNKYRVVGANSRKYEYLYYVEYGTSNAPAHPFLEKAGRDARAEASWEMRDALLTEIEKYLE